MKSAMSGVVSLSMVGLAVLLAACTSSGVSYAALEREAQPSDELPEVVAGGSDEIDADSARFVGEHDGADLWLARTEQPGNICLVVYPNDNDWVAGCGAEGGAMGVHVPSGKYVVAPDQAPTPEHATELSDNVYLIAS